MLPNLWKYSLSLLIVFSSLGIFFSSRVSVFRNRAGPGEPVFGLPVGALGTGDCVFWFSRGSTTRTGAAVASIKGCSGTEAVGGAGTETGIIPGTGTRYLRTLFYNYL